MAAISITPANVELISNTNLKKRLIGETLTAGMAVYDKTSDSRIWKADYSAAATAIVSGIVMFGGSAGSSTYIADVQGMEIDIGGTTVVGVEYYLGAAGAIVLRSDVTVGKYVSRIASGKTTTNLTVGIENTGAVSA